MARYGRMTGAAREVSESPQVEATDATEATKEIATDAAHSPGWPGRPGPPANGETLADRAAQTSGELIAAYDLACADVLKANVRAESLLEAITNMVAAKYADALETWRKAGRPAAAKPRKPVVTLSGTEFEFKQARGGEPPRLERIEPGYRINFT